MQDPAINLAGPDAESQRIWNTYVFWARGALGPPPPHFIVAEPSARLADKDGALLQTILFSTFALEYRLRSVYERLGIPVRKNDGLWALLGNLQTRTRGVRGLTGKPITFPKKWKRLVPRIQELLQLRNHIAHGKRASVSDLLRQRSPSLKVKARQSYNALIEAIEVVNVAIGYEQRRGQTRRAYYSALRFRANGGA